MKIIKKIQKIKNLKNKNVLNDLIAEIEEFSYENLPTEDSYVLIVDGKIIPCYISIKGNEILSLWVHPVLRGKGYGKFLVNSFPVHYVTSLPSALPFWHSLGFKQISPYKLILKNKINNLK